MGKGFSVCGISPMTTFCFICSTKQSSKKYLNPSLKVVLLLMFEIQKSQGEHEQVCQQKYIPLTSRDLPQSWN